MAKHNTVALASEPQVRSCSRPVSRLTCPKFVALPLGLLWFILVLPDANAGFSGVTAAAQIAPAKAPQSLNVPAGSGQDALFLNWAGGSLMGAACPSPCTTPALLPIDAPKEVAPFLANAKATVIALSDGKRIVRLDVEVADKVDTSLKAQWTLLLSAPLSQTKSSSPLVLWSGFVGKKAGLEGEESGNEVRVETLTKGARVVIGQKRDDLTICGRPALVSAKEVDPKTLTLSKSAMVDNLSADEKKKAEKVILVRETSPVLPPTIRLLRANAASSALEKRMDSLTDGSNELGWTEAKIGDGRGEWVRMGASKDVGIVSLSIQIRPTSVEVPDGAAPKTFYLATDDQLFEAELPDGAWNDKEARYEVKLPTALKTACLAVVLGSAQTPKGVTNPRVTIAEITARTAYDSMPYEALALALTEGGEKAKAASALLEKGDGRSVRAIQTVWSKLDSEGQNLATEVIDGAACTEQSTFYAERLNDFVGKKLSGPSADPMAAHARDRLRRCGRASADALTKLLVSGADPLKIIAAEDMAMVAPAEAVTAILDVLTKTPDPVRRDLRAALARAAKSPKSRNVLSDLMMKENQGTLDSIKKVDLLRAMGPVLPDIAGGKQMLIETLSKGAFRERYLLLAPAAELSLRGDAEATAIVKDAIVKDADPHLRARAAEVAAKIPALSNELVQAAGDPEVRVREAAISALAKSASSGNVLPDTAISALSMRLAKDDWTFVRALSADALSFLPKNDAVDKALLGALSDRSADVRGRAVSGLGTRKAIAYASNVKERANDKDETPEVRARALLSLGAMCDKSSIEMLTTLAQGARSLTSDLDRSLGAAALSALGDIHPSDLAQRIALLTAADAPALVREMAKAAISASSTCETK